MKNLKVWLKIISIMVMGLIGVGASLEMFENDNKLVLIPIVGISILVVVSSTIVFIKGFEDVTNPVEILCNNQGSDNSRKYIRAVCTMQRKPDKYINKISAKDDSEKKMLKLNYTTAQKTLKKFSLNSCIFVSFLFPLAVAIFNFLELKGKISEYLKGNSLGGALFYIVLASVVIGILIYIIYNFCMFNTLKMDDYIENYLFDIEPIKDNDSNQSKS